MRNCGVVGFLFLIIYLFACFFFFIGSITEISENTDPHVVANMFKQYFRDLPTPIFPCVLYQAFLTCEQQIQNR